MFESLYHLLPINACVIVFVYTSYMLLWKFWHADMYLHANHHSPWLRGRIWKFTCEDIHNFPLELLEKRTSGAPTCRRWVTVSGSENRGLPLETWLTSPQKPRRTFLPAVPSLEQGVPCGAVRS